MKLLVDKMSTRVNLSSLGFANPTLTSLFYPSFYSSSKIFKIFKVLLVLLEQLLKFVDLHDLKNSVAVCL